MSLTVGLTYDVKTDWKLKDTDPADTNAEFDAPHTVDHVARAIEAGGHKVKRIGNAHNLLKQIDNLGVDIVFNICEGFSGRNRESQVPVILEMHHIPFVGADGLTLGITLDKVMAKKCFMVEGVPTPRFFVAESVEDLKNLPNLKFPLMVKCRFEGSSKGISEKSRVENFEQLERQVGFVVNQYKEPALIEEFIRGTEFTVAVLGNGNPMAMPVVQVSIDGKTELGDQFYTFERISSNNLRYVCPAKIPEKLAKELQDIAVQAYKSVDCRDFGRVDFRVSEKGRPYVLEINPLPCLATEDVFYLIPQVLGTTYENMIQNVLNYGLKRYGLLNGFHAVPITEAQVRAVKS